MLKLLAILTLAGVPTTYACSFQWFGTPVDTDLRTPTPWTYTWTATMTGCLSTPTTIVEWDTVVISQKTYTAPPVTWTFNRRTGTISVVYSYPSLTVTQFTPGQHITDVYSFFPDNIPSLGPGGQVVLTVPINALTATTSTAPSTISATTSQTSDSSSSVTAAPSPAHQGLSSGVVGGIVGLVIVVVLFAAILGFVYYRRRIRPAITHQQLDNYDEVPASEGGKRIQYELVRMETQEPEVMYSGAVRTWT